MLKSSKPTELFEPGKLIVQFKPNVSPQNCLNCHALTGASLIQEIPELNTHVVSVESGKETEYANKYLSSGDVNHVELNYYLFPDGCKGSSIWGPRFPSFRPNDPFYLGRTQTSEGLQSQWGLRQINPEPAWGVTHSLGAILKIAIIDTGIDPNHPDLAAKIVDPINFFGSDPADYIDRVGHGTWTAGIAAAITNNSTGVAGTSFNTANIIPIRVGDFSLPLSAVLSGIIYAVQRGARVINMSLGFGIYSVLFQNAVDFAWNNGVVVIASAGNNGNDQVQYPAGLNYVLAVSATDKSNSLAFFSSWGVDVGVAAPGVAILATVPTYPVPDFNFLSYDAADGTSASAPFVTGVAALLFAVRPTLTNQEVVQIIQQNARPLGPGFNNVKRSWNPFYGYGLLNAGNAVLSQKGVRTCGTALGSFYGEVVSLITGLPIGGVRVSAKINGETIRFYETKTNVPTFTGVDTDGMFRLFNLPRGTYSIFVDSLQIQTANIVPGADTFLRLVV